MKRNSVGVVYQFGARSHYTVPASLATAGMLSHMHTDFAVSDGLMGALTFLRQGARRIFRSRVVPVLQQSQIKTGAALAARYLYKVRTARSLDDRYAAWLSGAEEFGQRWAADVTRHRPDFLYAFHFGSLELIRAAKKVQTRSIFEQTCLPKPAELQLLSKEEQTFPRWRFGTRPKDQRLLEEYIRREASELTEADTVVVPSTHVSKAVINLGVSPEKIRIIPYGVSSLLPATASSHGSQGGRDTTSTEPLRVLMLGSPSLFKGTPRALEAAKILSDKVTLRIAGHVPGYLYPEISGAARNVKFLGQLRRTELCEQVYWADVLLHPSICEGSSLAVSEALLSGLPVILTKNAGVEILDGQDGLLIEAHSTDAIVHALTSFSDNRIAWNDVRPQIRLRSGSRTLEQYSSRLIAMINEVVTYASAGSRS